MCTKASAFELPRLKMCKVGVCRNVATTHDGICAEHSASRGDRIKSYSSRPRPVSNQRKKALLGMELECFHPSGSAYLAGVTKYVCHDGSLPSGGAEIKAVGMASVMPKRGADIAQRARLAGGKVNTDCGFHVHLSLPDRWEYYSEGARRVRSFFLQMEDYFFSIVPHSRRDNIYCKPIAKACSGMDSHHCWASFSSTVPTIEIRIHSGTLNPWKVAGWLESMTHLQAIVGQVYRNEIDYGFPTLSETMDTGTLGYRYLTARESNPVLPVFGF